MRPSMLWHPSTDPADRDRIQPASLLHHCRNVYSQRGDDGIIAEIFRRLGMECGFFVEFGAWDGVYLANSRALFEGGWSGAFIESDAEKFAALRSNYAAHPQIICVNEWVGLAKGPRRTIDEIAAERFPDRSIDFLSIDIDGLDYRILETMKLRPKVIALEGGWAFHPLFKRRIPDDMARLNLSQSLSVLLPIGRAAGYVPVAFNQNVYFVRADLAAPFEGIKNDPLTLWRDAWFNESEAFREDLLRFRERNARVRSVERRRFAALPIEPLRARWWQI